MRWLKTIGAHLPLLALVGCLPGSGDQGLAVDPPSPAVGVGEQLVLTAEPLEDLSQEPEWEVEEVYGGGFLNSKGFRVTYVAPLGAGLYHLVLRAGRADGSPLKVVQEIRVMPIPQMEPSEGKVAPGGTRTFTVRMKGLAKDDATWSVEEPDGGSVSGGGVYRAPAKPGTYHVRATSVLDPGAAAVAVVKVE